MPADVVNELEAVAPECGAQHRRRRNAQKTVAGPFLGADWARPVECEPVQVDTERENFD